MNTGKQPLISVVINCYNGEQYLKHAIESVVNQSYPNWEIIFWDNQSTDRSGQIFKEYDDQRFKYYLAGKHTLLYAARNEAIKFTTGEFVAFLDVDDWWHPEKLSQQIKVFEDPKVGLSCTNYEIVKNGKYKLFRKKRMLSGFIFNELIEDYYVGMLTLMIRKSAYDSMNEGFETNYHILGDFDLVVRMSQHWKMECLQSVLGYYRLHANNESILKKERMLEEYLNWQKKITRVIPNLKKNTLDSLQNQINYINGGVSIEKGNLKNAFKMVYELSWGILKLKLFVKILGSFANFSAEATIIDNDIKT